MGGVTKELPEVNGKVMKGRDGGRGLFLCCRKRKEEDGEGWG